LASGLVDFAAGALGDLGVSRTYKTVSTGLGDGTVQTLVSQLRTLRPYAPVHIAGARDGSNNLTLTWTRRTRLGGHWQDLIDVPLGENSEAYEVDILDGGSVIRTITGLSSPTAEYTAVQQAADGLTPGDPVTMEVFQLSDLVGRGFAGPATV
jgi:hypothetical protein